MIQDIYPIERIGNELKFIFWSNNPVGTNPVEKVVRYERIMKYGCVYYNLSLGDRDKADGYIYDSAVTNNGDMGKVLKTVIATMNTFFTENPYEYIHIEGSDRIRNSFYQKIVRDYETEVMRHYVVRGFKEGENNLQPFECAMDYRFIIVGIQKKSSGDLLSKRSHNSD